MFLCFLPCKANAQVEGRKQLPVFTSQIQMDCFVFKSRESNKCRLDIYIQVPYSEIKFTKDGDRYVGGLDILVSLLSDNKQVWQKSQPVEVSLKDFSQTTSTKISNLRYFNVEISPGEYLVKVDVVDRESKKSISWKKNILATDFSRDTLSLSDIILVSRVNVRNNLRELVPNLSGVIGSGASTMYLFFEAYSIIAMDSLILKCEFIDSKKINHATFFKVETPKTEAAQIIWQLDTISLPANAYEIRIEAEGYSNKCSCKMYASRTYKNLIVRLKGLPCTIADIDKAIEQLIYVAKGSEIDYIKAGKTAEEKQQRFLEFWNKRDPDPKTPENELMEEYYSRVEYANNNFTGLVEGWKTDMGMILIRYGTPDYVERFPFNAGNKPYEIWYYYTQNRKFIFVDESGFGEYRLVYPTTDLWDRIR